MRSWPDQRPTGWTTSGRPRPAPRAAAARTWSILRSGMVAAASWHHGRRPRSTPWTVAQVFADSPHGDEASARRDGAGRCNPVRQGQEGADLVSLDRVGRSLDRVSRAPGDVPRACMASVTSGRNGCGVGLAPTGKRRLSRRAPVADTSISGQFFAAALTCREGGQRRRPKIVGRIAVSPPCYGYGRPIMLGNPSTQPRTYIAFLCVQGVVALCGIVHSENWRAENSWNRAVAGLRVSGSTPHRHSRCKSW